MSLRSITVAAIAALGLSLGAQSAPAGSLSEGAAPAAANAPGSSALIMVRSGGGGGHMGGGGAHMGGIGGMSMGGAGPMHMGPGFMGSRMGGPGGYSMGRNYGRPGGYAIGRHYAGHGMRGHWRNGRFFPFVGVGLWGYGDDWGGGSCYWNCRAAGYGPGYCSAYAANFCY